MPSRMVLKAEFIIVTKGSVEEILLDIVTASNARAKASVIP